MTAPTSDIIDRFEVGPVTIEIVEWRGFGGLIDPARLDMLYRLREAKAAIRQVRLTLNQASVQIQAGALQFQSGAVTIDNKVASLSTIGRWLGGKLTQEKTFRPLYSGTGEIWLEPAFCHYLILSLERETIIVDKGMYLCCDAGVSVEVAAEATPSAALLGDEGLFHTQLSGSGFVVLCSPVPMTEIVKLPVTPTRPAMVDGNLVLLRSGGVSFSIGKSAKSWLGTAFSGEGLLQTYTGNGEIWVAPLVPIYAQLMAGDIPPS